MTRLVVLVPAVLWFLWLDTAEPAGAQPLGTALFLAGLLLTVLSAAYAAVRGARSSSGTSRLHPVLRNLQRLALPVVLSWFVVGLFVLGWGHAVLGVLDVPSLPGLRAPALLLATLPVYLAWAGLLAAEYPGYRARREARVLDDVEQGLPIYPAPSAARFWALAVRQRLLFALVPLLLLMAARDATMLLLWASGARMGPQIETWLFVISALIVIAISPELIRRLLPTRPLEAGPLRDRLEALCQRTRLPMRDILVWDTGGSMVNAAVIGFVPGMRYVLLTEVLLDSMTPPQIEAVFAHEIGHVKHRHLLWYFVFLTGMTLFFAGPAGAMWQLITPSYAPGSAMETSLEYSLGAGSLVVVLALFGLLSRCFERQADVFAARTLQAQVDEAGAPESAFPIVRRPLVGTAGADIFSSSLRQAARLNHLPLDVPRRRRGPAGWLNHAADQLANFLHGTIRSRIDYLEHLARRPYQTHRFDMRVAAVKSAVIIVTAASALFLVLD